MKILCVIPYYHPAFQFGGPIASVHGLNKALTRKGIEVTVYTTNIGLKNEIPVNTEVDLEGVRVNYFSLSNPFGMALDISWQLSVDMTKALQKNIPNFDLIYINGLWNYPAAAACYYSRKHRKPYIIAPRGMLYRYTMGKKIWKKWPYYHLISKRDIRAASAIHYTTKDESFQCHSRLHLKNRALIIPNGVDPHTSIDQDTERLKARYPVLERKKVILFMSRISWKKGLDILAKAFGNIARDRDDVHLLIVGPDEDGYEKKVKSWLCDEEVQEKVTFTGMLQGKNKLEAFSGSDLFVLPSYSENFGMVVVEAMHHGLPVVISDQVGISDDVERDKAGIVIETDVQQLTSALTRLLDDYRLCRQIGERGRMLVTREYGWDQISDSMISDFNEIITLSD